MLPILSRGVQKVESRASLTWTWKKMLTLTSFQGFCVFVQFFVFKNTFKKLPKVDFAMAISGTPLRAFTQCSWHLISNNNNLCSNLVQLAQFISP
jgi:hypothetical protein